ncbi:tRNA (adenosine(37)-N6)-dimethylallyltransferase MiaA [uncultured Limosilactobacillus sp.]|uniref:tRNA (adenosine(37)-N6)-dimethylallyltransferase MiaA n=1 Tax=uncultured Limosilactobacillus sp. TaxID=2837629 RepID=UPI0025D1F74A|nr:tRNA (adenosine(37)-N6)-dimethylallyltransferase MiaA [uncultured Limosilactobacillus sp.]
MVKVVGIVGPTAVGKTALSIQLAKQLHGEVISGDSMQVYRGLNIGTAKIKPAEMSGVIHHLIDIRNINERFSVADFQHLANQLIDEISERGHLPIVVGGTGFYVQALTDNLALGLDHFDQQSQVIRSRWHQIAERRGDSYVWDHLKKIDPAAAQNIPVGNLRRVIRAIEVVEKTGKSFSKQPQRPAKNDFYLIGLNTNRQKLYHRINERVDAMIDEGLVTEAHQLYLAGGQGYQAGKGIGYRELFPYFEGEVSLQQAVDKIKLDSRHYAKRQLTWFRNKMNVHWFDLVGGSSTIEEIASQVIEWLQE